MPRRFNSSRHGSRKGPSITEASEVEEVYMTSIKKTGFLAVFLPLVAVCSGFYGCMTAGDGTVTIAGQVFDGLDADGNPLPAATVKVFEADGTTQDGPTVQTD